MKISIVVGSIRQERQSHRLAYYLRDQLSAAGATVDLVDLKDYPLPVFGSAISAEEAKCVEAISESWKEAWAVVFVTPEYHSNIPAALANVLEYSGRALIGKVIGIASASASKFGGLHASNILHMALGNLGAYPAPRRLLVPEIYQAFDSDNRPAGKDISDQAEKFIRVLITYVELMFETRAEHSRRPSIS